MSEEDIHEVSPDLSTGNVDNWADAIGALVDTGRGRLRILQRQPTSLRRSGTAPSEWLAETLAPRSLPVGTVLGTPFGPAFITRTAKDATRDAVGDVVPDEADAPGREIACPDEVSDAGLVTDEVLLDEMQAAADFAARATSESTRRAYERDWSVFEMWAGQRQVASLPAEPSTVAVFLASQAKAGLAPPTLWRRLAAIAWHHRAEGFPAPQDLPGGHIRQVMSGIERDRRHQPRKAMALVPDDLARLIDGLSSDGVRFLRDRALLLLGFAGAFRRSELLGLQVEDIEIGKPGATIRLRVSKTDQVGKGHLVRVPRVPESRLCAVSALERWLAESGLVEGPLFRRISKSGRILDLPLSESGMAVIMKNAAKKSGLPQDQVSAHSLRRGWLTSAARSGARLDEMMSHSRHRSPAVALGYVEAVVDFETHVGRQALTGVTSDVPQEHAASGNK